MKYKSLGLFIVFLMTIPSKVLAYTNCSTTISTFIIEAERKSDTTYSDLLLIRFKDSLDQNTTCGGAEYAYIENTAPSHNAILSVTLWAASLEKTVTIKIDESDMKGSAARIEFIYPTN